MPIRGFAKSAARRQAGYVSARPHYVLGGLNEDENPRAIRPDQLTLANNCARLDSMTGTRPGLGLLDGDWDAAISGTPTITGIHEFSYESGSNREIVVVSGADVRTAHDATPITKTSGTITSGEWVFADFQDKTFAAGGAPATDSVWYYDGTDINEIGFSFTTNPKYIFSKWNFLFVGGLTGTTYDDNPMVARYCDYATDATDVTNWPSTNVIPGQLLNENFGAGSFGSEYNTGFGEFFGKDQDFLLFLTNKRIMAYTPNYGNITGSETAFRLSNTIPVGCVSQKAFVNLGADAGDAIFMNKDGVHSLAQSRQYGDVARNYLSYPIRKTFATLNQSRLDQVWGAYWPQEGIVLFACPTGSSTTNNLILCCDIKGAQELTPDTVRWYKWTLNGVVPTVLQPVRGTDGKPYIYCGTTTGEVGRFNRESYQDIDSTGTISVAFQTANDDFQLPSKAKHIGDAFITLKGTGSGVVQHTLVLDDGTTTGQTSLLEVPQSSATWGPTGGMIWGQSLWSGINAIKRHRVPGTGESTTVGHRFQRAGANAPFFVSLIDQQVKISGSTLDQEANTVGN